MSVNLATIGLHAARGLYAPSKLLEHLRLGEEAGFSTAMCSDHFYPWTPTQGHSGHSFTWLAAALARTHMSMGTICYPCGRYHPAVLAQTSATLAEMFPDRFWLALGTGEAVNESITGQPWPAKQQRREMVDQSAQALRALWRAVCRRWPIASLGQDDLQNFTSPDQFAQATCNVCPTDLHGKLRVSSDLARHAAWIEEDASLGITTIYLHNIGDDQERFIRFYAEQVIPQLSLDLIPS